MGACVVTVVCASKAPIFQCSTAVSLWMNSRAAPGPMALRLSLGAGFSANLFLVLFPDEKVLLVCAGGHRAVEKAHHHFVVGLLAPAHLSIRIRIVRIRLRIVVPSDGLQFRAPF